MVFYIRTSYVYNCLEIILLRRLSGVDLLLPSFFCFRKHLSLKALYKKKCVLCEPPSSRETYVSKMPTTAGENNKCVDGSEYYGDTTYLWRNAKVLGIIVGCTSTTTKKPRGKIFDGGSFLSRSYLTCLVRSCVSFIPKCCFITFTTILTNLISV